MRRLVLMAVLVFLAGAAPPRESSGDPELDQAIAKANRDWQTAMHSGNAALIAAAYEDDAAFVGRDGTSTRGRAAITALMRERFARQGLAFSTTIEPRRIVRDGDLAIELGAGEIRHRAADGKEAVAGGRYLTVWRHRPGGWRIHRNVLLP